MTISRDPHGRTNDDQIHRRPRAPVTRRGRSCRSNHSPITMPGMAQATMPVRLNINGSDYQWRIEPRTTLPDALRDTVGWTGTRKECDRCECDARKVHIQRRRVVTCMTLEAMRHGKRIRTFEGLWCVLRYRCRRRVARILAPLPLSVPPGIVIQTTPLRI